MTGRSAGSTEDLEVDNSVAAPEAGELLAVEAVDVENEDSGLASDLNGLCGA